jgi:hypothetical protein
MHAVVRKGRIDIHGANGIAKTSWEPLLDELKAIHISSLMQTGKRVAVGITSRGQVNATIYPTIEVADDEKARILERYGIEVSIEK